MSLYKTQFIKVIILTAIIVGLTLVLQNISATQSLVHPKIWGILIFSAIVAFLVAIVNARIATRIMKGEADSVVSSTVLRLILSAIYAGIILFQGVDQKVLWVINFFIVYLFYVVFEIYTLITNLRPNLKKG